LPGIGLGGGKRWAIVGVAAFVVVDALLVGWAVASVRATPAAKEASSVPTVPPTTPRPTPTATVTPQAAIPNAVAPSRMLAALNDTVAWRAVTGACPATRATLEHTSDGGASWKQSDAAGPTGASSILRITVASTTDAAAITLDGKNCTPQYIGTYVSGDNWATYPAQLGGSWYLEPAAPTAMHSPKGDVTAPCGAMVGLAAKDASNAAVLCADHTVYRTSDAGASWGKPLAVTGSVALAATADGYVAAATTVPGCAGVAVSHFDAASGGATPSGCFATATPQPGTVAVASGASTLWLWAGDAFVRSSDGGSTWR
jgi:hypothetical protein